MYTERQIREISQIIKEQEYAFAYEDALAYLTNIEGLRDMTNIPEDDDTNYDFVTMAYDYLDTLHHKDVICMENEKFLLGYIGYINQYYNKYVEVRI